MNSGRWWLALLPALLLFSACKKKSRPTANLVPDSAATAPAAAETASSLLPPLQQRNWPQRYFTGRMKLNYQDGQNSFGANASLRIEMGQQIWMSITPALGIEAMRVHIRKDSIFMLNRLANEYSYLSLGDLQRLVGGPVTFEELQGIMLGVNPYNPAPFSQKPGEDYGRYATRRASYKLKLQPGDQLRLLQVQAAGQGAGVIDAQFNGHQNKGGLPIPDSRFTTISWPTPNGGRQVITLDMILTRGDFTGEAVEFPFSVPGGFKRFRAVE